MRNRFLFNVLFVAAAIVTGFLFSMKPWRVYQRQSAEAKGVNAQAIQLEKKREELIRKRDQLQDPLRKEESVRQMGYVKKDEVPIK